MWEYQTPTEPPKCFFLIQNDPLFSLVFQIFPMSSDKRTLRLLGNRLSSIFNVHEAVTSERKQSPTARPLHEMRAPDHMQPPLSVTASGNVALNLPRSPEFSVPFDNSGQHVQANVHQNMQQNNQSNTKIISTTGPPAQSIGPPGQSIGSPDVHQIQAHFSPSLPQTPSRVHRKPPPGNENELFDNATPPISLPLDRVSKDAFAEMKNMVGNELDLIMGLRPGLSEKGHVYYSVTSEEETAPLNMGLQQELHSVRSSSVRSSSVRSSIGSPSVQSDFQSNYHSNSNIRSKNNVHPNIHSNIHSDIRSDSLDPSLVSPNSANGNLSQVLSNIDLPRQIGVLPTSYVGSFSRELLLDPRPKEGSVTPAILQYSEQEGDNYPFGHSGVPSLRREKLGSLNDREKPLLFVETPVTNFVASSYYDSDPRVSPISTGLNYLDHSSSGAGTPQLFTSNNVQRRMEDTRPDLSFKTEDALDSQRPESLWVTESIYSDAMELPADSYVESVINSSSQSQNNFQTRAASFGTVSLLLESPTYTGFGSASNDPVSPVMRKASSTRPRRNKLLLLVWPASSQSFNDGSSSLQMLSSSSTRKSHLRVSSTSSIISGSNLASLKRSFTLRPGEGERSSYVTTIRKNAGTSYNEAGPVKWKLPLGIMHIDNKAMAMKSYTTDPTRFNRGGTSLTRSKKSSGVELKHGHLQPRLLAAEIDEVGDTNRFGSLGRSSTLHNKTLSPVLSAKSKSDELSSGFSRVDSLTRTSTLSARDSNIDGESTTIGDPTTNGDSNTNVDSPAIGDSTSNGAMTPLYKSSRASGSSFVESIGSADGNVDAYYQHRSYRFDEMDDDYNEYNDEENMGQYDDEDAEEKPHLVLANPDSSSDHE